MTVATAPELTATSREAMDAAVEDLQAHRLVEHAQDHGHEQRLDERHGRPGDLAEGPAAGQPDGVVFSMSNGAKKNKVLVWSRAANGSLTFVGRTPTGGRGTGGGTPRSASR